MYKAPMQELRRVSHKLADFGDAKWTATTLYVLGKRVVFTDPRTNERQEVVSGQRVLDIPLKVAISDTRKAIQSFYTRDNADAGKIIQTRFVMQNEPVFAKTRIPVATVKRYLEAGFSADAIIAEFPQLTNDDITSARIYQIGADAA